MESSTSAQFTIGHCAICADDVLSYVDMDGNGLLVHKCLDCDAPLSEALRAVPSTELAEHGYEIAATGGGGCGSGGCGSGGCGVRPAGDDTH